MKTVVMLLCGLLPAAVIGQCVTFDDPGKPADPSERRALYLGEQKFAIELLNIINNKTSTENIFFSPFSIYSALILAYFTSANHTEKSIKKTLYIPDTQDKSSTMRAYVLEKNQQLFRSIVENGLNGYELMTANRLFVSNKLSITKCMKEVFNNEIVPTDFAANPQAALDTINTWVANKTKNNIKDLLKSGQVTATTRLVLVNAAYFKGLWKSQFKPEETKNEPFYITVSQTAMVTMMKQNATFNHLVSEKLGAHVLELPYKGEDVSLVLLLPPFSSSQGISNILQKMKTIDLQNILDDMIPRPVDVKIPKFNMEYELQLAGVLETMGVGDLFKPTSDLSSLTGSNDVTLDDAVHKAKITVDEEGTTAAAATALFNFRSSRPLDPATFHCDHPFIYIIFDRTSQTILFSGVYNKPPKS